jgi:Protein of unknown function (DUF992)
VEVLVKNRNRMMVAVTGLFLFALSAIPAHAAEKVTVKTGYLTCDEAAGWGFIIGSSDSIHCTYTSNKHRTEYYTGTISKFGADIGYLQSAVILWAVAASTTDLSPGPSRGTMAARRRVSRWELAPGRMSCSAAFISPSRCSRCRSRVKMA